MAALNPSNDQYPVTEPVVIESSDNDNDQKGIVPAWLISLGTHALAVAIMAAVVYGAAEDEEKELRPIRINDLAPVVKEKPPQENSIVDPTEIDIAVTDPVKDPQPLTLVVPEVEDPSTADANADGSPGRSDAVADVETDAEGDFMAIGAGNQGAGMFSLRHGPGKIHGSTQSCRGPERAQSMEAALRWFKRHQSLNGMWDVDQYQANCTDGGMKCEPGVNQAGDADIACTSYAVMCFLGAGYDHITPNKHRTAVAKAVDWLLAQQKADGMFGERNYEHAVATMALSEAWV